MILLTPMFSLLKEKYNDCSIDVICGTKNHPIIKFNPYINNIFILDKQPIKLVKFIINIRKFDYDYYIDPKDHFSRESSLLAKFVKARKKIGFNSEGNNQFDIGIPSHKDNQGKHYSLKVLNPLIHLGIILNKSSYRPVLFESPDSIDYVNNFLNHYCLKSFILINISASKPRKMWDTKKWIEFINNIQKDNDFDFVITSAPTESEELKYIIRNTDGLKHFVSRNILDIISLIKNCNLLITPDTALVHIAAAFNIRLLGLYANLPAFFSMFHPLSDIYEIVMTAENSENIKEIEVTEVLNSYKKIINKPKSYSEQNL